MATAAGAFVFIAHTNAQKKSPLKLKWKSGMTINGILNSIKPIVGEGYLMEEDCVATDPVESGSRYSFYGMN